MHPKLERTIAILGDLIAFPTISSDSNLALITYIEKLVKPLNPKINFTYDTSQGKANILISLPDESGSTQGGILLSGHTDVVPVDGQEWKHEPFKMTQRDGKLFGRGSCDMKGFIAACLAMFPDFAVLIRKQPLHMAFSFDEEVGCLGAGLLVEEMRRLDIVPKIAIIGEPTDMQVIEGHKGCYDYTTYLHGLAGHGSLPHLGVSAVEYGVCYAHKLLAMQAYLESAAPKESCFDPAHTTLIIGGIRGGVAHNVIADHCEIDWQMRPVRSGDDTYVHEHIDSYAKEELLPKMQAVYKDASIEKKTLSEVGGLEPMPDSQAREVVCQLVGNDKTGFVSYGTEAGLFQGLGTSCVVCGPGSIRQAHKADEFVSVSQMEQCLQMLSALKNHLNA